MSLHPTRKRRRRPGLPRGASRQPLYVIWSGMLARCENPGTRNYRDYGGRGIKVCDRWHDFNVFCVDMGPRPSLKHSLDRWPDHDGHYDQRYCRLTCRKADTSAAARNARELSAREMRVTGAP